MDDTTGRVDEIREEIAQTRVDMAETIGAIQERLTPANIAAQAGETVRNAATQKVKQMTDNPFVDTIKDNPSPAAMIGIGAAWLLMKGRTPSSGRDWRSGAPAHQAVGTAGYREYGDVSSEVARMPELGGEMRDYRRQSAGFERVVRDNPLALGAAAAIVGAAIGASIPASETENRLMGEARDTVVDRARDLASEAADKVKDIAR